MIKMLVMDVDGTLTDGKIYMSVNGEVMKAFSAHDAVGVRKLKEHGIMPVIITGRESRIVLNRAIEMNMDETKVFQNIKNKLSKLEDLLEEYNISYGEVAYIGDDENDLECMKVCGVRGCPKDAMEIIKKECQFISSLNAGDGAVREFIEYIINKN